MGIPAVEAMWNDLSTRNVNAKLTKLELRFFKKFVKVLKNLEFGPSYPGLKSHQIEVLSKKYGKPVWESFLENNTPSAGRVFWVHGPGQREITILAVEPHPEQGAYFSVSLSNET